MWIIPVVIVAVLIVLFMLGACRAASDMDDAMELDDFDGPENSSISQSGQ